MLKLIIIGCSILIAIVGAYLSMIYIYKEKDPRKWKPILSTKDDTCYSMFKDILAKSKSTQKNRPSSKK